METRQRPTDAWPEFAGVLTATVLCGIALLAHSQTPSVPPSTGPSNPPPAAVGPDGRPLVAPVRSMVLADPDTKMYSPCMTGDEREAPDGASSGYVRPPRAKVITEEAAKAQGFRAGAHKVSCK